ncbi:glycosyltransferase 87 family protein [Phytomonospora sp. NPDC050363]|uniref:glycosyltransferase 87 family protein n=1 Tax=Phytomonospora sp. NPDC050363 TaxID=3155642 RepID=UPI0034070BF5
MPLELRSRTATGTEASTVDRVRKRRRTLVAVGGLCVVWAAALIAAVPFYRLYDLRIYHNAIAGWLDGDDLYAYFQANNGLGFTYPPFGAFFLTPITAWPMWASGVLTTVAGVFALLACLYFIVAPFARERAWSVPVVVLTVGLAALAIEPVRQTLGYGQINLVLAAMVLADMAALRSGSKWAGLGIGLATAIKLTPALFIVYLLVARRWRAAAVATGTTLLAWGIAFAVAPGSSVTYWGAVFWNSARVGRADFTPNQSLAGFLARLYDRTDTPLLLWISFGLLMLVLGLTRALAAHKAGDELSAFAIIGLTANVISPISWSHHLVWAVPAVAVLVFNALERRSRWIGLAAVATYTLFVVSPIWFFDPWSNSHWTGGPLRVAAENSFAVAIIVLVAALPHSEPRRTRLPYPRRTLAA